MGLEQPDVSALVVGRTGTFSIDRLVRCLDKLDDRVDVVVRQKRRGGRSLAAPSMNELDAVGRNRVQLLSALYETLEMECFPLWARSSFSKWRDLDPGCLSRSSIPTPIRPEARHSVASG